MRSILFLTAALAAAPAWAGSYSGPSDSTAENAIDGGIAFDSPRFTGWANGVDATRTSIATRGSANPITGQYSLGDLDATQITNGVSPGYITATFAQGIRNGDGADFAAFENAGAFYDNPFAFVELAYVEVSSDGTHFARFPSLSTNTTTLAPYGSSFAGVDLSNVHNLAGKHIASLGTPFDLQDLANLASVTSGQVDLNNIQYVKFIDIPGSGAFKDSSNNGILDAWVTPDDSGTGTSGGYDFALGVGSGVGVINAVPEPTSLTMLGFGIGALLRRRSR